MCVLLLDNMKISRVELNENKSTKIMILGFIVINIKITLTNVIYAVNFVNTVYVERVH